MVRFHVVVGLASGSTYKRVLYRKLSVCTRLHADKIAALLFMTGETFMVAEKPSFPLLHHDAPSLKLRQITQHHGFIAKFFARESGHKHP
jgi:hypothetical protein